MQNTLKTGFISARKPLYYDFGEYRLDVLGGELLKNGKPIELTPKSMEILQFLIRNRGRLIKRKELLDSLWANTFVEESNLTQHIYLLRKVLKQNSNGAVPIETISKTGYRFIGQVEEIFQNDLRHTDSLKAGNADLFQPAQEPVLDNLKNPIFVPQESKKVYWIIGAIFSTLVVALGIYLYSYQYFATNTPPNFSGKSIAVLPFHQINSENQENIGLGMADVIITQLGKLENVQIIPTGLIIQYAENNDLDSFEVGEKLKADLVLMGTIHREGEQVRVTYQVFSIKDKHPVISDKIDEKFTNVFSLQDTISEQILHRISLTLSQDKSLLIVI